MHELLKNAIFVGEFEDDEHKTKTMYFSVEKDILQVIVLSGDWGDAVSVTISLQFPTYCMEVDRVQAEISPVGNDGKNQNWKKLQLTHEEIGVLLSTYDKKQ